MKNTTTTKSQIYNLSFSNNQIKNRIESVVAFFAPLRVR